MTKQDLINLLLAGIKESDAGRSDTVTITKRQAMELVSQLLSMKDDDEQPLIAKDGQVLFYCADCGQSFWADAREDTECFEKWHYHRWFGECPVCRREVVQNDRYWR